MRVLGAVLACLLLASGCAGDSGEQEYLRLVEIAGWTTNSEFERQEALEFGYGVCDLMREGVNPLEINSYGPVKGYAAVHAGTFLCPELNG